MIRYIVVATAILFSAISVFAGSPALSISGTARVVDGDTITIRQQRIRLAAIDACELAQTGSRDGKPWPCGIVARSALAKMIDGKHVRCEVIDQDQYGRAVAECFSQSQNIGVALVRIGMAETLFQYLPFGHGLNLEDYIEAQRQAKGLANGMWSAQVTKPQEFRRGGQTIQP